MKKLFTKKEFDNAKNIDKLKLQCRECKKEFYKQKTHIITALKGGYGCEYCSQNCSHIRFSQKIKTTCKQCGKICYKRPFDFKRVPNHYCSRSCSSKYNIHHKKTGCRRSKLEIWLEEKLKNLYPKLNILFNNKEAITSELDIYFPSFKLAFELNGIYHYEPIHGIDRMKGIQDNDNRKMLACAEKEIELCVIDSTSLKYFKEEKCKKFLDIITKIIDDKLVGERK